MARINDKKLRTRTLERQIDTLGEAIGRARGALLAGNIMAFVIATVLFNVTFGWNKGQLDRRAKLAQLAHAVTAPPHVSAGDAVRKMLKNDPAWSRDKWIAKVFDEKNHGDLSYLKFLDKSSLEAAAIAELVEHIKREKQFGVVSLPLVGVAFSATDLGILGGLAMTIAGFWLIGSLRKQGQVLVTFVHPNEHEVFVLTDDFEDDESRYALESIVNAPVFSASYTTVGIAITYWLFFFPPASVSLAFLYELVNFFEWGVPDVGYPRLLLVAGVCLVTIGIWFNAWLLNRQTETALKHWSHAAANKDMPPSRAADNRR